MEIQGNCDNKFKEVKDLFESLHSSGREVGSYFAVERRDAPLRHY